MAALMVSGHHLVALAAAGKPFADQRFGFAALVARDPARIDVGGVDEIQARVDQGVQQRVRAGFVDGPAEDVAAEGEWGDLQAGTA
ncbi:hypothetical protein G6F64_015154 [Rhizopus arrhizus]|uniref:Uncharacterized protein n=1 Tax=Rhizopus oryzae TaxID=64495 RepID=A0A9P7BHV3_RHIOR|nr:hypothetical protein G6F64_015154 [Rhizopus arrhizus]